MMAAPLEWGHSPPEKMSMLAESMLFDQGKKNLQGVGDIEFCFVFSWA